MYRYIRLNALNVPHVPRPRFITPISLQFFVLDCWKTMAQQWTNKSQTQIQKSTSSNSSCLLCASQFQKAVLFFNVSLCRVLSHKIEKINIWTFGGKLKKRFCYFFALTYLLSLVSFQSVFIHVKFFTSKSILNKKLLRNETKTVRKMETLIRWIFLCQNKWVNTNHEFLNLVFCTTLCVPCTNFTKETVNKNIFKSVNSGIL